MKRIFLIHLLTLTSLYSIGQYKDYKVTLKSPEGWTKTITCPDDQYILDAAEENGIYLPYSCRCGADPVAAGKLESGTVDQSEQSFLDWDQIQEGYVLLDIAYATSDCTIRTHMESELIGDMEPGYPYISAAGTIRADHGGYENVDFESTHKQELTLSNSSVTSIALVTVETIKPYTVSSSETGENRKWAKSIFPLKSAANTYSQQLVNGPTYWQFSLSCSADNALVSFSFINLLYKY